MDDSEWVNSEKEACSASFSYWAATGKSTGWNWPLGWKRSNEENRHLPTSFLGLFYPTLKKELKSETMILGGGPCSQSVRRLNCILQDLFRDTPLDHILRAQICTQICIFGIFGHIWHIWARKIWSSGVSLKRSCKLQFRRIGLRSIGPSSQKLWPNQIFGRFPHCNYNVKLKMARKMSFMGL